MKLTSAVIIASFCLVASAVPAPRGRPARGRTPPPPPNKGSAAATKANNAVLGAAFFMTNEASGNFVMASTIGSDGQLTTVRAVATGGKGQHANSTGPDGLFSQGCVKVGGNNLFAVNPGSNTLSMFAITPNDPANIKLVGKPVSTSGEFPVSVAVNSAGTMVCALNGGKKNGVACFKPSANGLTAIPNTVRNLGITQTTPATGPAGSASHVLFSADGKQLIASVKGAPPAAGFLAVWAVEANGSLSQTFQAVTPPAGGALPFGMAVIDGATNALLVTDPGVGFDVMDLSKLTAATGNASTTGITSLAASNDILSSPSSAVKVDGEDAVCWAAFSKKTGTFFLTDIGTSLVTEVAVDTNTLAATIVGQHALTPGSATLDDAVATINGNDFLYVLAANLTSVDVMSLQGKGQATSIQSANFAAAAKQLRVTLNPNNVQGMTVFVS